MQLEQGQRNCGNVRRIFKTTMAERVLKAPKLLNVLSQAPNAGKD